MKASKEQLTEWQYFTEHGTVSDIKRVTGLSIPTINKVLNGDNVLTCNFIKVHGYFKKLKAKVKRLGHEG